jgi:hypothetical protein
VPRTMADRFRFIRSVSTRSLVCKLSAQRVRTCRPCRASTQASGGVIIRVVLHNHSAHISKETMAYMARRPGRFEFVHTPKHGSWLNLVESAFGKMARSCLRHIRASSLKQSASLESALLHGH